MLSVSLPKYAITTTIYLQQTPGTHHIPLQQNVRDMAGISFVHYSILTLKFSKINIFGQFDTVLN